MIPASSTLERGSAALVVIDEQERLAAVMDRRTTVLSRTELLVQAAAITGVPVIVTRQYPKGLGDTEPQVASALADVPAGQATVVDKLSFDCFAETAFTQAVCATGARQLVIAGMETHICVAQTALAGLREGFDVHVVTDACCSRELDAHEWTLHRLAHAGAVLTTAESVAYELVGRAGTDEFKRLLGVVKG